MKKWYTIIVMSGLLFLVRASMAMAAAKTNDNPITTLKKEMGFNWGVLNNLGWLFYIIMIPLTLVVIGTLVFCIWKAASFILKVARGKESLNNKMFWIELGVVILFIFLFISGAFLDILEQIYNWTSNQDIGTGTTE
ncbi:hypothetical protein [Paenibacillus sp. MMO-58]|uniref:hypothetical protein n=1 Tax=Paenibacillus sp. MMO-58 TaxID=3081290 RepID=UPI00301ADD79